MTTFGSRPLRIQRLPAPPLVQKPEIIQLNRILESAAQLTVGILGESRAQVRREIVDTEQAQRKLRLARRAELKQIEGENQDIQNEIMLTRLDDREAKAELKRLIDLKEREVFAAFDEGGPAAAQAVLDRYPHLQDNHRFNTAIASTLAQDLSLKLHADMAEMVLPEEQGGLGLDAEQVVARLDGMVDGLLSDVRDTFSPQVVGIVERAVMREARAAAQNHAFAKTAQRQQAADMGTEWRALSTARAAFMNPIATLDVEELLDALSFPGHSRASDAEWRLGKGFAILERAVASLADSAQPPEGLVEKFGDIAFVLIGENPSKSMRDRVRFTQATLAATIVAKQSAILDKQFTRLENAFGNNIAAGELQAALENQRDMFRIAASSDNPEHSAAAAAAEPKSKHLIDGTALYMEQAGVRVSDPSLQAFMDAVSKRGPGEGASSKAKDHAFNVWIKQGADLLTAVRKTLVSDPNYLPQPLFEQISDRLQKGGDFREGMAILSLIDKMAPGTLDRRITELSQTARAIMYAARGFEIDSPQWNDIIAVRGRENQDFPTAFQVFDGNTNKAAGAVREPITSTELLKQFVGTPEQISFLVDPLLFEAQKPELRGLFAVGYNLSLRGVDDIDGRTEDAVAFVAQNITRRWDAVRMQIGFLDNLLVGARRPTLMPKAMGLDNPLAVINLKKALRSANADQNEGTEATYRPWFAPQIGNTLWIPAVKDDGTIENFMVYDTGLGQTIPRGSEATAGQGFIFDDDPRWGQLIRDTRALMLPGDELPHFHLRHRPGVHKTNDPDLELTFSGASARDEMTRAIKETIYARTGTRATRSVWFHFDPNTGEPIDVTQQWRDAQEQFRLHGWMPRPKRGSLFSSNPAFAVEEARRQLAQEREEALRPSPPPAPPSAPVFIPGSAEDVAKARELQEKTFREQGVTRSDIPERVPAEATP